MAGAEMAMPGVRFLGGLLCAESIAAHYRLGGVFRKSAIGR